MLGRVDHKVVRGGRRERGGDLEENIGREEIRRVIGKLKDGKAVGIGGIPSKAWKYTGEKLEE